MDSSVIFLVVIGLWAAILVPYWLRRREDLSTSRTADRFSAAMRVLSHRSEPDATPRERAVVPVLRSPRLEELPPAEEPDEVVPLPRPVAPSSPRPRRVRAAAGVLLLLALVAVPVLTALSFAGVLLVWAPMPAAAVVVALVLGLRATARRPRRVAPVVHGVVHAAPDEVVVEHEADDVPADVRDDPFDEDAHRRLDDDVRIRRLAEEAVRAADVPYREPEPGEWTPVQVPLPSYLLKPHARPAWQGRTSAQPALPVCARRPPRAPARRRRRRRHPHLRPAPPRCRRLSGVRSARHQPMSDGLRPGASLIQPSAGGMGLWRSW